MVCERRLKARQDLARHARQSRQSVVHHRYNLRPAFVHRLAIFTTAPIRFALAMFAPNQAEVRHFFCSVFAKAADGRALAEGLQAIEALALEWLREHPEYASDFADVDAAVARSYTEGINPFLHLSMHLSISEQCSIDQPPGIRAAVEQLLQTRDLHEVHHLVMEELGLMLWERDRKSVV